MRRLHQLAAWTALLAQLALSPAALCSSTFVVNPYVQMGPAGPISSELPKLNVQFGAPDKDSTFQLEWRNKGDTQWNACPTPTFRRVATGNIEPFRLYTAQMTGINHGASLQFRILQNRHPVHEGSCVAPKTEAMPQSFAVFGDMGIGSLEQAAVARQVYHAKPDYAVLTGDLVYGRGTISEYLRHFFPIMNADDAVIAGAPLMSSTLCVACPGNHDLLYSTNLDSFPDGLGYFTFWSQPLNGPADIKPTDATSAVKNIPPVTGSKENRKAFLTASGQNFPRMAQFSFNYGNAHWTVLDANPYMDWSSPQLRAWLDKDLAAAKNSQWRFVALHQSPFTSNLTHLGEQRMRLICDLFEKHKVDIVFSGHSHDYERSYPLHFTPGKRPAVEKLPIEEVKGSFQFDRSYDGKANTSPHGVLYVVTGAGGASLNVGRRLNTPFTVQPFTAKLVAQPHSFTLCEITGPKLHLRQISDGGRELDSITIDKHSQDTEKSVPD